MKKKHRAKRTLFPLLGSAIALLFVFFACDFEASKIGRTIGGSLAEGDTRGNEFIEGGSGGGLSTNLLHSGDLSLPQLSKNEIREMLDATDSKHLPSDPTQLYTELPNYTAPYKAGKIKKEYLELTLARLNALRRFSGLPKVVMTDEYNDLAQHGAALMVITQGFGHGDQPRPKDMDEAFHKKGIDGTDSGNVYPQYPLIDCIDGYNRDPGNPGVGHRLGQMRPGLEAVGIGSAIKKKDENGKDVGLGGNVEVVNYTQAPEGQKPKPFDWKFISYPSSGYFPLMGSLFGNPASWSVQLNTNHYAKIGNKAGEVAPGEITVYLIRTSDNKTWQFYTGCDTGYFSAGGNTIIFRILEDGKDHPYKSGETYQVQIRGLKDAKGTPVDFAFETEFFTP